MNERALCLTYELLYCTEREEKSFAAVVDGPMHVPGSWFSCSFWLSLFALLDHVTVTFIHFLRSFLFAPVLFYIRSCWLLFLLYFCIMVNQCCLPYCKSGANGFKFPNAENHPELREKWIKFVSQVNFKPSEHTRICIEHFEEQYIKFGKRNHLIWESLPIPTIHTNEKYDKNVSPSSLTVPKPPRRAPRKRIFQEDQMGPFLEKDRIKDFDSLSEADCLPGFTFIKENNIVIMYRLVIDQKTKIPVVHESITINSDLHISLSYCGFHVPLPDWFRSVHNCRLSRRSQLDSFPPYMRSKGEEMNPILQEMRELEHYKKKGRPKYSANMIR